MSWKAITVIVVVIIIVVIITTFITTIIIIVIAITIIITPESLLQDGPGSQGYWVGRSSQL